MWSKILRQCASFMCCSLSLTSFLRQCLFFLLFFLHVHPHRIQHPRPCWPCSWWSETGIVYSGNPPSLREMLWDWAGGERKKKKRWKKAKKTERGADGVAARGWGAARRRQTGREGVRRGAEGATWRERGWNGKWGGRCASTGVWNRPDICSVCLSVRERDHKAGRVMETGSISPSHSKNTNTSG